MAIRDKMKTNAAKYLAPEETIQAVFCAQTLSSAWALLSYWIILLKQAYRVVVVTDKRTLVCRSGRLRYATVTGIEREVPRETMIGPIHGTVWYKTENLGGMLHIHRRFWKDVEAADALIAQH